MMRPVRSEKMGQTSTLQKLIFWEGNQVGFLLYYAA
jgi:hypothetical protein